MNKNYSGENTIKAIIKNVKNGFASKTHGHSFGELSGKPTTLAGYGITDADSKGAASTVQSNLNTHTGNTSNPHGVTKTQIGLGNVENKSSATIRSEITSSNVTTALGFTPAELDSNGKVPASQLPSYVDDVLEYSAKASFPSTGESGKIYIDTSNGKTYRWGGSAYAEISESLALGETSSTAYRGDRGKAAYDHSLVTSGNPHGVTKSDVGLGNAENKSSATIRSEITSSNVTTALGFTPVSEDHSHDWDDLNNRPFGEGAAENEIVSSTLDFASAHFSHDVYSLEDFALEELVVGKKYKVYWNNESYECVGIDGGSGYVYLGNYKMSPNWDLDETVESDEPFFITMNPDYYHSLVSTSSNVPVTMKIMELSDKQLDEKFIPDTIARKSDLTNVDVSNLELITVEDIDTICNTTIEIANLDNEVRF